MPELIQVQDLHKSFQEAGRELHVLQGLNVEISEGMRLAIVGESGVGKSTLLYILGTLDRPTGGRVLFQGRDLSEFSEEEISQYRNREIGFVFQFHYLLPDFDAIENVMLPTLVRGWGWEKARRDAARLLEEVGLKDRMTHRPGKLSGGEQQRVALARSLILEPKIVLADEPTGDLDPRTGEEVQDLLLRLNDRRGSALIVATHNQSLALRMGQRMELRGGQLFPL
jgi:lipoprotein-releasing system ATP-binding protein